MQFLHSFHGRLLILHCLLILRHQHCLSLLQIFDLIIEHPHLIEDLMLLHRNLAELITLTLIFAVAREDLLLLADQIRCGYQLHRSFRIVWLLCGKLLLAVCNLTDRMPIVVCLLLLLLQDIQLIPDTDDLQQRPGFFSGCAVHKLWQVQRQLLNEAVQHLLAGSVSCRVRDLQSTVLSFSFDDQPVGEHDLQIRRCCASFSFGYGRSVSISAQGPGDTVQDRCLPLAVTAADDGQAVFRQLHLDRFDSLYVFQFKLVDLYTHLIPPLYTLRVAGPHIERNLLPFQQTGPAYFP